MISIKSISTALYDGICTQSRNIEDFEKCVDDLRKPFINKIQLKSFKQSYELEALGVTEFILPGRHSITEEMSPKLFLNKVIINFYTLYKANLAFSHRNTFCSFWIQIMC